MKWFYNLKISAKLIIGFLIVAFIAAFLGILGVVNVKLVTNNSNLLYNQNTIGLSEIGQVQSEFLKMSVNIRTMALVSKDKMSVYNDRIKASETTIKDNMDKISINLTPGEETTNYNSANTSINDYQKEVDKIAALAMENGTSEQIASLITASDDAGKKVSDLLQNIYNINLKEAKQRAESNDSSASRNQLIMIGTIAVAVIVAIVLGLIISNIISKPLNKLLKVAKSISEGDINIKLDIDSKDEVGHLANVFEKIINALNSLVSDTNMLAQSAVEGNLEARADVTKHCGSYKLIVEGVNSTLDAITEPLNESRRVLAKMAVNDLTMPMTGLYKGTMKEFSEDINSVHARILHVVETMVAISEGDTSEFDRSVKIGKRSENDKLMPSMLLMMSTIQDLVKEATMMADAATVGKLEVRSDSSKFKGGYREILGSFNKALDAIEEPINESRKVLAKMAVNDLSTTMVGSYQGTMKDFAADINSVQARILHVVEVLTAISVGDTNELEGLNKVGKRSENDKLMPSIIVVMTTLQSLIVEASMIADSAANGNLQARSDTSKFQGGYSRILDGFNKALDAIEQPINESRSILAKLAVNDLSMTMAGSYKGTMKEFAKDINSVHTRLTSVVKLLSETSIGDTSSLEGLVKIGRRCENDKVMPAFITMMGTIQNLVKEASMIAASAVKGDLQARSDASKFQGGYREILDGFNKTLDAIEEPINEVTEVLKDMAGGDLCVSMTGNYQGSYQTIKDSLNHTLEAFNELLGNITEASEQVLSGSTQVSDGSQALSQGTTEQASAIEELTASIVEVAAQTKQNAVNASQANELALDAKEGATLGNSHMKEMLKSMEEINESSSNISKIIKVIDDIAFQTNILALNAAVEAARAGQHGKGFAVVAEEVRNLAARSASAAKETTDLIEGSIKKVELGTKIANNTAESLDQIVVGVSKAATLVGEIAAASNEQATAISQINKGIEQVSDVVQTNSATAEQSAAASEELSGQASMLKSMVGKFKLKRGTSVSYNEVALGAKKNEKQVKNKSLAYAEAAVTKNKPRISLSNMDFGKY